MTANSITIDISGQTQIFKVIFVEDPDYNPADGSIALLDNVTVTYLNGVYGAFMQVS